MEKQVSKSTALDMTALMCISLMILGAALGYLTDTFDSFEDSSKYLLLIFVGVYFSVLLWFKDETFLTIILLVLFWYLHFPVLGGGVLILINVFLRRI